MERGSSKKGPMHDDEMSKEVEPLDRAGGESRSERDRVKEDDRDGTGHRISGSGTSTDSYPYRDKGEEGAASHPVHPDRTKSS